MPGSVLSRERSKFHEELCREVVRLHDGVPNFADRSSATSSQISRKLLDRILYDVGEDKIAAQAAGKRFEDCVLNYVEESFSRLKHIRPGNWKYLRNKTIADFEQYEHLTSLKNAAKADTELASVLGVDYLVKPDIVVSRVPERDEDVNRDDMVVDDSVARLSPIRSVNQPTNILLASISCKWSIRSDRSQNSRTEALNVIRNRKGRVPSIVVVTAEPLPSRIASIALGTGDIDCTYHVALDELLASVKDVGQEEAVNLMKMMIDGKRLRDISDLPLDLAI